MEASAASVLTRAVELEKQGRYTEASVTYQEGIQLLLNAIKGKNLYNVTTHSVHRVCCFECLNNDVGSIDCNLEIVAKMIFVFPPATTVESKKLKLREATLQYLDRAEKIKKLVEQQKEGYWKSLSQLLKLRAL